MMPAWPTCVELRPKLTVLHASQRQPLGKVPRVSSSTCRYRNIHIPLCIGFTVGLNTATDECQAKLWEWEGVRDGSSSRRSIMGQARKSNLEKPTTLDCGGIDQEP